MPAELSIYCELTGLIDSLYLNDGTNYKLEASSMGDTAMRQRKITATNPFVEGEFVVSSVRENATEQLAVYCYGASPGVVHTNVRLLTDALSQPSFTLYWQYGDFNETWSCQAADYNIKSSGPLRVAKMALVTAQVPRRPTAVLT